jgi:hypothetical protein
MSDQNPGFGLFVLGQKHDIRRLAELTAEPWKALPERQPERSKPRIDFLMRLNRLFESETRPDMCCSEPLA